MSAGPLRVVHVAACPFPSPQGTQLAVAGLAAAQAAAGHAVTLLCYGHGEGPLPAGLRVLRAPAPPGYRRLRSGPDAVKPLLDLTLAAALRRLDADVVHAHHVEGLAAALVGARAPVVFGAHTLLGEELPTYLPAPAAGIGPALGRLGEAAEAALARRADAVLCLSARAAARFRAAGCRRVLHSPPGLDPDEFVGHALPPEAREPVAVYAGNPDGYQELGRLRSLPAAGFPVRVVSAEPPPASWSAALAASRAAAAPTGAAAGLSWVQARRWEEARPWVARARVGVVPRRRCGGFPMKLLNYAGLGLPSVVTPDAARGLPGEHVHEDLVEGVRAAWAAPGPQPAAVWAAWAWERRVDPVLTLYRALL